MIYRYSGDVLQFTSSVIIFFGKHKEEAYPSIVRAVKCIFEIKQYLLEHGKVFQNSEGDQISFKLSLLFGDIQFIILRRNWDLLFDSKYLKQLESFQQSSPPNSISCSKDTWDVLSELVEGIQFYCNQIFILTKLKSDFPTIQCSELLVDFTPEMEYAVTSFLSCNDTFESNGNLNSRAGSIMTLFLPSK